MKLVNDVRRWRLLILVSALMVTVPLTVAEARGPGGGGGGHGGIGGGAGREGFGHSGGFNHGGFGHGFHGHGFSHVGFRGSVVIGLGGWWDPWWYGAYWPFGPYPYGASGYAGYGYRYPYGGYDPSYAYPPAVPPAGYDYGVETFQAPPEPPPVNYPAPPGNAYQAPPVSYQAPLGPQPASSGAAPAGSWMPTDPRAVASSPSLAASLQIEVTPGETEILVDGVRVGMAKEFQGPVTVPVAAGSHALGFRVGGLTIIENIVASPQTTVLIKRDLGTVVAPQQ